MNDFSKRKGLLNSLIVSVYRIHYGGAEQHVVYFDNAWGGGLHMLKRVLIHKIQSQKNSKFAFTRFHDPIQCTLGDMNHFGVK